VCESIATNGPHRMPPLRFCLSHHRVRSIHSLDRTTRGRTRNLSSRPLLPGMPSEPTTSGERLARFIECGLCRASKASSASNEKLKQVTPKIDQKDSVRLVHDNTGGPDMEQKGRNGENVPQQDDPSCSAKEKNRKESKPVNPSKTRSVGKVPCGLISRIGGNGTSRSIKDSYNHATFPTSLC